MKDKPKDIKTLDDLTPDSNNFNKHTEFGQKLLEDSLRKFGAGRSVLVDKDGNIIAGNGVVETAAAIGMDKIKVVETDGTELVVVRRKDLELDSPEGRELALADNMTALKGIDIDLDKVRETLDYDYQHEPIFYTWTKSHHNYRAGKFRTSVWTFDKPRKCDLHPTMKPVGLVSNCMFDTTKEGDNIIDLFGGSGTTLIAAEQLNRKCYMMELDPHYCDVIIARWEKLTGNKAERITP